MKIAYLSVSRVPSRTANSVQVMKMCQAMAELGHDVHLVSPRFDAAAADEQAALRVHYGLRTPFSMHWLGCRTALARRAYTVRSAWRARQLVADAVYTRDVGVAACAARLGLPTIFEVHHVPEGRLAGPALRRYLKTPGRHVVAISEALGRELERMDTAGVRAPILVEHDGVDLERYEDLPSAGEAAARIGLDARRFRIGYTGQLYPAKGIDWVLHLATHLPEAEFLIVGGDEPAIRARQDDARQLGVDNVRFAGFVANEKVPLYQASCDVLLMPYRPHAIDPDRQDTSAWMSPLKMFEYMAAQRLIVASDLPVVREILNETNAVLCGPTDTSAWVGALRRAMHDAEWRRTLVLEAWRDVQARSWRTRAERILAATLEHRSKGR